MKYRVAAGVVAIVAVVIGILRLLRPGCHAGYKFPIKYLSTKSPYIKERNLSYDFTPVQNTLDDLVPAGMPFNLLHYCIGAAMMMSFMKISKVSGKKHFFSTGCKAELVWIVARHGTRNPGEKTIRKMLNHIKKLRDEVLAGHDDAGGE